MSLGWEQAGTWTILEERGWPEAEDVFEGNKPWCQMGKMGQVIGSDQDHSGSESHRRFGWEPVVTVVMTLCWLWVWADQKWERASTQRSFLGQASGLGPEGGHGLKREAQKWPSALYLEALGDGVA